MPDPKPETTILSEVYTVDAPSRTDEEPLPECDQCGEPAELRTMPDCDPSVGYHGTVQVCDACIEKAGKRPVCGSCG